MQTDRSLEEGFVIKRFMVEELSLSGGALLVYGLIYSFSSLGKDFYGTKEYIAQRTGTNVATVHRALAALKKMGLIAYWGKRNGRDLLQAIYPLASGNLPLQNARLTLAKCDTHPRKMQDDNKEIIKNTSTSSTKRPQARGDFISPVFSHFGTEGIVMMTEEQWEALCNLLGDSIAEDYVRRLETYIINNPAVCLKSHYEVLVRWASEDCAV